jgi:hemerythrin
MKLEWSKDYCIGDAVVDAQHEKLFELTNSFCYTSASDDATHDAVMFLVNYAVQHFDDEEALQLRVHYPNYDYHKKCHEDFKTAVNNLAHDYLTDKITIDQLKSAIVSILPAWLLNHVTGEDKKIGLYMELKKY